MSKETVKRKNLDLEPRPGYPVHRSAVDDSDKRRTRNSDGAVGGEEEGLPPPEMDEETPRRKRVTRERQPHHGGASGPPLCGGLRGAVARAEKRADAAPAPSLFLLAVVHGDVLRYVHVRDALIVSLASWEAWLGCRDWVSNNCVFVNPTEGTPYHVIEALVDVDRGGARTARDATLSPERRVARIMSMLPATTATVWLPSHTGARLVPSDFPPGVRAVREYYWHPRSPSAPWCKNGPPVVLDGCPASAEEVVLVSGFVFPTIRSAAVTRVESCYDRTVQEPPDEKYASFRLFEQLRTVVLVIKAPLPKYGKTIVFPDLPDTVEDITFVGVLEGERFACLTRMPVLSRMDQGMRPPVLFPDGYRFPRRLARLAIGCVQVRGAMALPPRLRNLSAWYVGVEPCDQTAAMPDGLEDLVLVHAGFVLMGDFPDTLKSLIASGDHNLAPGFALPPSLVSLDYSGELDGRPSLPPGVRTVSYRFPGVFVTDRLLQLPPSVRVLVLVCEEIVDCPAIPGSVAELYVCARRAPSAVRITAAVSRLGIGFLCGYDGCTVVIAAMSGLVVGADGTAVVPVAAAPSEQMYYSLRLAMSLLFCNVEIAAFPNEAPCCAPLLKRFNHKAPGGAFVLCKRSLACRAAHEHLFLKPLP